MKKFENIIALTIIILISTLVFITGCQKNDKGATKTQKIVVYDPASNINFNIDNPNELRSIVKVLAREKEEIQLLESDFKNLTTRKGKVFRAITAKYRLGDEVTNMVVPLIPQEATATTSKGTVTTYVVGPCEMKCTSSWGCRGCDLTVIEECKSISCNCSSSSGGCSSKITVPKQ